MTVPVTIRIQQADFDIAREIAALTKGRTDIGAVVSFSGICRGSEGDQAIAALTLEHYAGMAEAEITRHAQTALSRWPAPASTNGASRRSGSPPGGSTLTTSAPKSANSLPQ